MGEEKKGKKRKKQADVLGVCVLRLSTCLLGCCFVAVTGTKSSRENPSLNSFLELQNKIYQCEGESRAEKFFFSKYKNRFYLLFTNLKTKTNLYRNDNKQQTLGYLKKTH